MSYAVVRTDKMFGTDNRAGLVSIKYLPLDDTTPVPTAIENGNVLKVGALVTGEREVFAGTAPAANTPLNEVVLIATPEVMYDERKHSLDEFINEAGAICRGYAFHSGDIFSVTKDALAGAATPAVGNIVELKADTKLNVVSEATSQSTVVGKIIAIDVVGPFTYYAIKVD